MKIFDFIDNISYYIGAAIAIFVAILSLPSVLKILWLLLEAIIIQPLIYILDKIFHFLTYEQRNKIPFNSLKEHYFGLLSGLFSGSGPDHDHENF